MKDKIKNVLFSKPLCFIFIVFCVLVLFNFSSVNASVPVDTDEFNAYLVDKYNQGLELLPDDVTVYDYIVTDNRTDNGGFYFYYFISPEYDCIVSGRFINANFCYIILFDQPNYDTPNLVIDSPKTDGMTSYTSSSYIIRSSFNITSGGSDPETVFTQTPLPLPQGVVVEKIQGVEMEKTLEEIVKILPVILIILVGLIGLRKALAMLFRILRQS